MAQLAFPTRPGVIPTGGRGAEQVRLGEPNEAEPCDGHHAVIHDETCVLCGHYPHVTIRRTFEARAKAVARS